MKKITLLAVAFVAITFASCKKDRTCSCTQTSTTVTTGYGAGTDVNSGAYTVVVQKGSKTAGKVNCLSTKTTDTNSGGSGSFAYTDVTTTETTCTLK